MKDYCPYCRRRTECIKDIMTGGKICKVCGRRSKQNLKFLLGV